MEFETTTDTSRSGLASDPQGPSSLVVDWNATILVEVLPADPSVAGGIRLRSTYEKSTASVSSDTFDPTAAEMRDQYARLQGKVVEFTLDASGNVQSVVGLEGIVDQEKAAHSARDWVAQLSASAGAPPQGVVIGQTWSSEQPANSLPIAGLVWRTDSHYLRNEACHPPNPNLPPVSGSPGSAAGANSTETCAVILANLGLVRTKTGRELTPGDLRKNGVESAGTWSGSAQGLVYVSLVSGLVESATQTGTQQMDVTLTTAHGASMRYRGTISSRSHVALIPDETKPE